VNCVKCKKPLTSSRQKKYCSKSCKINVALKSHYLRNKEKYIQRREQWRKDNPLRTKFLYAKADIKRRGRGGLHISYEKCLELWATGCSYCAKNIEIEKGCSLDRLDNSLGYTEDNVVPCCGNCNTIKSDILTFNEMRIAMAAIIQFRKSITDSTLA